MKFSFYRAGYIVWIIILMKMFIYQSNSLLFDKHVEAAQGNHSSEEVKKVSFCRIVEKPQEFSGRTIQTKAILVQSKEATVDGGEPFFYDLSCNTKSKRLLAEYDQSYNLHTKMQETLNKVLSLDKKPLFSRAKVEVVGRFESAESGGFGHLDAFRFRFIVISLIQAYPIPESSPVPKS